MGDAEYFLSSVLTALGELVTKPVTFLNMRRKRLFKQL